MTEETIQKLTFERDETRNAATARYLLFFKEREKREALEAENARLREALQPFADKWERVRKPYDNGATWTGNFPYAPHKAAWEALNGDAE